MLGVEQKPTSHQASGKQPNINFKPFIIQICYLINLRFAVKIIKKAKIIVLNV